MGHCPQPPTAERSVVTHVALPPAAGGLTAISVCTGSGALDLALGLVVPDLRPVLYVEGEAFAVAHLECAIEALRLAPAPIWSDARTVPGRRFRGCVDLIFGGIPCQPHSEAGSQLGAADPRDLWPATRRLIAQAQPWAVFIENVGNMLSSGGAYRVFRDLRRMGFEVEGGLFTAAEVGLSHERERLFILAVRPSAADASGPVADRDGEGPQVGPRQRRDPRPQRAALERDGGPVGDALGPRWGEGRTRAEVRDRRRAADRTGLPLGDPDRGGHRGRSEDPLRPPKGRAAVTWSGAGGLAAPGPNDAAGWSRVRQISPHLEPVLRRVVDGLASGLDVDGPWPLAGLPVRIDRLRMLGNGVVPLEAAFAFRTLAAYLADRAPGAARLVRVTL